MIALRDEHRTFWERNRYAHLPGALNGLEIVDGHGDGRPLRLAEVGTLHPEEIAALDWHALPTEPGDVVVLDSWVPHRSGPNRSRAFPPECERVPGAPLPAEAAVFNLGDPIRQPQDHSRAAGLSSAPCRSARPSTRAPWS